MLTRRRKNFLLAACLSTSLAFAHQSLAWPREQAGGEPAARGLAGAAVLRGRSLARFGGYELNIAFTPDGRIVCFDISAAPARAGNSGPKA